VGGDDVPEEHCRLQTELLENAVDDRRRRLGRATAGELPLGREGDAREAGATVAGRLADEEQAGTFPRVEVRGEPLTQQPRTRPLCVLVERRANPCGRELVDEGYDSRSVDGELGQPG
jgi:hypothetical protein